MKQKIQQNDYGSCCEKIWQCRYVKWNKKKLKLATVFNKIWFWFKKYLEHENKNIQNYSKWESNFPLLQYGHEYFKNGI